MRTISEEIETTIEAEDWNRARKLLREELKREPESHWLLTRLSTTYYEQKKYDKALEVSEKATELAPSCPLVQWDRAGALDMTGRTEEAIQIWKRLLRRGQKSLEQDPCSEGSEWCASLLNDCRYRLSLAYVALGHTDSAIRSLRRYLAGLDSGTVSLYGRQEAEARLSKHLTDRAKPFVV